MLWSSSWKVGESVVLFCVEGKTCSFSCCLVGVRDCCGVRRVSMLERQSNGPFQHRRWWLADLIGREYMSVALDSRGGHVSRAEARTALRTLADSARYSSES